MRMLADAHAPTVEWNGSRATVLDVTGHMFGDDFLGDAYFDAHHADEALCFSLELEDRCLFLLAYSEAERARWVEGVRALVSGYERHTVAELRQQHSLQQRFDATEHKSRLSLPHLRRLSTSASGSWRSPSRTSGVGGDEGWSSPSADSSRGAAPTPAALSDAREQRTSTGRLSTGEAGGLPARRMSYSARWRLVLTPRGQSSGGEEESAREPSAVSDASRPSASSRLALIRALMRVRLAVGAGAGTASARRASLPPASCEAQPVSPRTRSASDGDLTDPGGTPTLAPRLSVGDAAFIAAIEEFEHRRERDSRDGNPTLLSVAGKRGSIVSAEL